MKKLAVLVILFLSASLYAAVPENINTLFPYIKAFCYSVAASYAAFSPVELPGVKVEADGSFIPDRISFEHADLESFRKPLLSKNGSLALLPLSVSRPLAGKAASLIDQCGVKEGDFIACGEVRIAESDDISFVSLLSGNTETIDIAIAFDTVICGTMFDGNASLNGQIYIRGTGSRKLTAECGFLTVDGFDYTFLPVETELAL